MTTPTMALAELAEKGADVDLLRQMVQFMAQRLMEIDVEGRCGAGYDEKAPGARLNSRNGYRDRTRDTRAGSVELDERVHAFLERPIEGDWPYLWIDAAYVKTRESGRIVSVAVAVNTDGQRQVLGMKVGASEAEAFWTTFLRSLARRGLRGVKLVISDDHDGLKAGVTKLLEATWQHCRVHFMRNALAYAPNTQRRMVSAAIAIFFAQDTAKEAHERWRVVAEQWRGRFDKIGSLMDGAEHQVLAHMDFSKAHRL